MCDSLHGSVACYAWFHTYGPSIQFHVVDHTVYKTFKSKTLQNLLIAFPVLGPSQPRPWRTSTRRGSSTEIWNPRTLCCSRGRRGWVQLCYGSQSWGGHASHFRIITQSAHGVSGLLQSFQAHFSCCSDCDAFLRRQISQCFVFGPYELFVSQWPCRFQPLLGHCVDLPLWVSPFDCLLCYIQEQPQLYNMKYVV